MSDYYLGIDVGGTNIKLGCFDVEINMVGKSSVPTNADMGPDVVIEAMATAAEKLVADHSISMDQIRAVGLGTPGPAQYKKGIIDKMANLHKFENMPIRQMLSDRLSKPVTFDNDANVACFGEYTVGAGKDVDDMVMFTLGTGIGGGIVNQGKLLQGAGDNATELGHIIIYPGGRKCGCGQLGCVEAYASASSTAARAAEAVADGAESTLKKVLDENGQITCKDVFDQMAAGDKLATEIVDGTAKALAVICINMLHVTEPARIVFAGGMIAAGDVLMDKIRENFKNMIWNLRSETIEICFATLGEDAGIVGAASLAKYCQEHAG